MHVRILGLAVLFLLSGCMHYSRLTPSDFNRGQAPQAKFARDNYECRTKAVVKENMVGGGGDLRGTYNHAYVACMTQRGYASNDIELLGFGG